ncbi:hypothetical protein COMA1_20420 [Candidatus Nitrospira nitrosa]|uniref:Uncharacterized protein n=1 Tax=Candidatus Nitrospira nitrosa TaxID=1742972 RepID=A0A0S4LG77_9BACT|nr:hypothetical protein COMA1_20420 [Candidatus Nitrospira nitrosa]
MQNEITILRHQQYPGGETFYYALRAGYRWLDRGRGNACPGGRDERRQQAEGCDGS